MCKVKSQKSVRSEAEPPRRGKVKTRIKKLKFLILSFGFAFCVLRFAFTFAQDDLEFNLDVKSATIALPKIFYPNIDLSGRGFHRNNKWPQGLSAPQAIDIWAKDIGFKGMYRLQYNLWEIQQLAKEKEAQDELLRNYEELIRRITDAGGIVILDIFGTPAGLGKVLDKRSSPYDFVAFKELVKAQMKNLSCDKKYNIWYEVWSAPDLDDFFLGTTDEYLRLYSAVAQAAKELEAETKIHIPVGGPAVSWWFQNCENTSVTTPERSLIYQLIKFCSHNRLPLDFISWHAFSADAQADIENTIYKKSAAGLMRTWLSYFNLDGNIPLIVSEWNFDAGVNTSVERADKSYICASYIISRLKNMYEAGVDSQIYFSLEDFQNNKEKISRNTGVLSFDPEYSSYKGKTKAAYDALRMLKQLGSQMYVGQLGKEDSCAGIIATRKQDELIFVLYNYIDVDVFQDYLSRNIAALTPSARNALVNLIKTGKFQRIIQHNLDIANLDVNSKLKTLLTKALELSDQARKYAVSTRSAKIKIKNLNSFGSSSGKFIYQRFTIDSSCAFDCKFFAAEEKEISAADIYEENLSISPYSLQMIILKNKPVETAAPAENKPQEIPANKTMGGSS